MDSHKKLLKNLKETAHFHEQSGILESYPKCCIKQFVKDISLGRLPYIERCLKHKQDVNNLEKNYVLCDKCVLAKINLLKNVQST